MLANISFNITIFYRIIDFSSRRKLTSHLVGPMFYLEANRRCVIQRPEFESQIYHLLLESITLDNLFDLSESQFLQI